MNTKLPLCALLTLAIGVFLIQPALGQDPVRRTAARIIFEAGGRVVSLIVERRSDLTIGIIGAAAWDGTKAAVSEAFSFGGSKTPPPNSLSCQVLGTSSINCEGVGKLNFDFKNSAIYNPNPLGAQDCSIFSSQYAKVACEAKKSPTNSTPTPPDKPLLPDYLNVGIEPSRPTTPAANYNRFLHNSPQLPQPGSLPAPSTPFDPFETQQPAIKPVPIFEQPVYQTENPFGGDPYKFYGLPAPGR